MTFHIRKAHKKDAADLCIFIDMAGDGMPTFFWSEHREVSSPLEHARSRAQRDKGEFSYTNAHIAEDENQTAGMILTYPIGNTSPDEANYSELPDYIKPLVELEDLAPNSLYINVLSIYPEFRSRGLGHELMTHAIENAKSQKLQNVSYITTSQNTAMMHLGEKLGFQIKNKRPLIKYDANFPKGDEWVLLTKSL